jgi:hypothetical protein
MAIQDGVGTWFNLVLPDMVNACWFGAKGDNVADDAPAIQAAIDYAIVNKRHGVYLPEGNYRTSKPLFLDMPVIGATTPLRAGPPPYLGYPPVNPSPSEYQYSFSLEGASVGGLANQNQMGTMIYPTFHDDFIIYVGPAQGMRVMNLILWGQEGAYHGQLNPNGGGIGYTGTGGGSTRTYTENVGVFNRYVGFKTSANGNGSLGDSNTWVKCFVSNAYYGFYIAGQQNFINSFYDCNPNNCTVGLFNGFGNGNQIFGGNWSNNSSVSKAFPITSVSGFASHVSANNFYFTFTMNITGDDGNIGKVYNSFALLTTNYGVLSISCSNTAPNVLSCTFGPSFFFPRTDALVNCDLAAEIASATWLYCAETVQPFWGNGTHVHGVHIENAWAPTLLIHTGEGFGSNNNSSYEHIVFNYDPSLQDLKTSPVGSDNLAKWYVMQSGPFIQMDGTSGEVLVQNSQLGLSGKDPGNLFLFGTARFVMRECNRNRPLNVITDVNAVGFNQEGNRGCPALGMGEFDEPPFIHTAQSPTEWRLEKGSAPCWGVRPAPYTRPAVDDTMIGSFSLPLSRINYNSGNWVLPASMWGTHVYGVTGLDAAPFSPGGNYQVISDHKFYTYGEDLTPSNVPGCSWHYKGACPFVYADPNTMSLMYPGLGVILNNGVDGDILYVITGTYPSLGYFTVCLDTLNGGGLAGNKTTVYSGTTIKQQKFKIRTLNEPPYQLPLLDTATGGVAAYGFRKLRTAYAGAAVRIRRSSDNTEADIGFGPGEDIDTLAFNTFVGSSNAFVTKWYDQVGANDVVQATLAKQPRIIVDGYRGKSPCIIFDPTNATLLERAGFTGITNTMSAYHVSSPAVFINSPHYVWDFSGPANHGFFYDALSAFWGIAGLGNLGTGVLPFPKSHIFSCYLQSFVDAGVAVNGQRTTVSTSGLGVTMNPTKLTFGATDTGTNYFNGFLMEAIFFSTDYFRGDRKIWGNQAGYFGL